MGIHWQELIIILLIVLILFGPKRLPEIGSSLGRGIRGFRDSMNGMHTTATPSDDAAQGTPATDPAALAVPVEIVEPTPARTKR